MDLYFEQIGQSMDVISNFIWAKNILAKTEAELSGKIGPMRQDAVHLL